MTYTIIAIFPSLLLVSMTTRVLVYLDMSSEVILEQLLLVTTDYQQVILNLKHLFQIVILQETELQQMLVSEARMELFSTMLLVGEGVDWVCFLTRTFKILLLGYLIIYFIATLFDRLEVQCFLCFLMRARIIL